MKKIIFSEKELLYIDYLLENRQLNLFFGENKEEKKIIKSIRKKLKNK